MAENIAGRQSAKDEKEDEEKCPPDTVTLAIVSQRQDAAQVVFTISPAHYHFVLPLILRIINLQLYFAILLVDGVMLFLLAIIKSARPREKKRCI